MSKRSLRDFDTKPVSEATSNAITVDFSAFGNESDHFSYLLVFSSWRLLTFLVSGTVSSTMMISGSSPSLYSIKSG